VLTRCNRRRDRRRDRSHVCLHETTVGAIINAIDGAVDGTTGRANRLLHGNVVTRVRVFTVGQGRQAFLRLHV